MAGRLLGKSRESKSLQRLYTTPRGVMISIRDDMLNICQRVQEGDATIGWAGDPNMFVSFNNVVQKYEIWRRCEDGLDRMVKSWDPDKFDQRVLMDLRDTDTWRIDVLKKMDDENARIERAKETDLQALQESLDDFIKYANKRLYGD